MAEIEIGKKHFNFSNQFFFYIKSIDHFGLSILHHLFIHRLFGLSSLAPTIFLLLYTPKSPCSSFRFRFERTLSGHLTRALFFLPLLLLLCGSTQNTLNLIPFPSYLFFLPYLLFTLSFVRFTVSNVISSHFVRSLSFVRPLYFLYPSSVLPPVRSLARSIVVLLLLLLCTFSSNACKSALNGISMAVSGQTIANFPFKSLFSALQCEHLFLRHLPFIITLSLSVTFAFLLVFFARLLRPEIRLKARFLSLS